MPENIARVLHVVRILLEFGRHIADTIEHRMTGPGAWIFTAVFATTKLPIMRAHLHRGILRAAALESLLLKRAATGRDVAPLPLPAPAAPGAGPPDDPCHEPFPAQVARLVAARQQYDAPVDPDHLADAEAIEAEVRARPIGRTIADICRDLGLVAMMCTGEFWDAATRAIAGYPQGAAAECLEPTPPAPEPLQQQPDKIPDTEHMPSAPMDRAPMTYPSRTPAFQTGGRRFVSSRSRPAPAASRGNVLVLHRYPARAPAATGPPQRAAMQPAA